VKQEKMVRDSSIRLGERKKKKGKEETTD